MHNKILNIRIYPDAVLKKTAATIQDITDIHMRLIDSMFKTMHSALGVGLAAPQVGISQRLIVIQFPVGDNRRKPLALINPRIIHKEGEIVGNEGCLSFPEISVEIKRHSYVEVAYEDPDGKTRQLEGSDLLARILQHEIDHLNGTLFIDHLGRIKRDLIKRKLRKNPPVSFPDTQDSELLRAFK